MVRASNRWKTKQNQRVDIRLKTFNCQGNGAQNTTKRGIFRCGKKPNTDQENSWLQETKEYSHKIGRTRKGEKEEGKNEEEEGQEKVAFKPKKQLKLQTWGRKMEDQIKKIIAEEEGRKISRIIIKKAQEKE